MRTIRARFWIEVGAATVSGLLTLLTLFWHDWIEVIGWNPDQHNGTVEWLVVGFLAAVTALTALLARIEWRRPQPAV
jgi:hypothetical protein